MNKFLVVLAAALLLGFSGCASKTEAPKKAEGPAEPHGQEIAAYYYAPFQTSEALQAKLQEAGFDLVGTYQPTKKSETILVTTAELKAAANKPGRGFGAVVRLLVDEENNRVAVSNPVYFGKAFFQDDYDHALGLKLTDALKSAAGEWTPAPDQYDYDDLGGYHFMVGMPYYEDVDELAEGDTAALLEKAESYKKGKEVVFVLPIGEGRTLVGMKLSKRTSKFVKKIGEQNAQILPYAVLIEEGKAVSLAAKYNIAISYPLLSMGEFMTIATVPGAIEKDLKKVFK